MILVVSLPNQKIRKHMKPYLAYFIQPCQTWPNIKTQFQLCHLIGCFGLCRHFILFFVVWVSQLLFGREVSRIWTVHHRCLLRLSNGPLEVPPLNQQGNDSQDYSKDPHHENEEVSILENTIDWKMFRRFWSNGQIYWKIYVDINNWSGCSKNSCLVECLNSFDQF